MRNVRTTIALSGLILLIALTSCTVREELSVRADGSGSAHLSINLSPILVSYYTDLVTAMTGVPGEYPVFDIEQLAATFEERPSVELTQIERTAIGRLTMDIRFQDVNAIGSELERNATDSSDTLGDAFSFERDGSRRVLNVRLDRSAVNSFLSFAPPESAMMTDFLFPPADGSVTRAEYQEELAWALEEYAPADEVKAVLDDAAIEVVITPEGRIQSQVGGEVRGNSVVFRVPILELLTLNEERVYRVVFVP